ncbi:MAG: alkaline phosphatase family protein [Planctomycetota bacterium]
MSNRSAHITRRTFLKAGAAAAIAGGMGAAHAGGAPRRRVLVLGIDGMDPGLLQRYVAEGRMPNFARLMKEGGFKPLRSSIPPQSPVAWSNFITGMNPGAHGIFDFIHRDPATLVPYFSTSRTSPPTRALPLGGWRIPIGGGSVELLRKGPVFWKILADRGVPCSLYRLPVNFPPVECGARSISGLGTPDLQGAYGISTYISDVEPPDRGKITSAAVVKVDMSSHKCEAYLTGPENTFRKGAPATRVSFTIHRDPSNPVARITIQGQRILLRAGEWSDWVRVRFTLMPCAAGVSGMCRFFLKEVHPRFKLYVSPVNIDPADPALPISTPSGFAAELARELGPYHTQGIAEDTKALSSGLLSEDEYLQQAMTVYEEQMRAYDYFLRDFRQGLLFFYISSIDLNSHMYWRSMDPRHPLYTPELGRQHGKIIEDLYVEMDGVLGKAYDHMDDDTTLIVMSDHGFGPFYRMFNVNSWLLENGYASLVDPYLRGQQELFANTNWQKTVAYGLGINSIYLNLQGRERNGVVPQGAKADALVSELVKKLEAEKDPETGERILVRAYPKAEVYRGECAPDAPDIVLGYSRGYRASWATILGTYEKAVVGNNDDKWSGDHCMDVSGLPGVLLSNRPITSDDPALIDLAPTILAEYGMAPPPGTEGKVVLERK